MFFRVTAVRPTLFFAARLREAPPAARFVRRAGGAAGRARLAVADGFAGFAPLGTPGPLLSDDRADCCTSVNRNWSPSELYAQISATGICRSAHSRFAVSMLETGMYR